MHRPTLAEHLQPGLRTLPADARAGRRSRRGLTVTELLVVVAIIVILLGTLFVAISAASRRAQGANTQALMNSISAGLGQFQTDFGYLPPVLGVRDNTATRGRGRDVVNFTQHAAGANIVAKQQNWVSYTTLAEYLVGYGHRGEDGYGRVPLNPSTNAPPPAGTGDREAPPFGIRSPGSDGCWGAFDAPNPAFPNPTAILGTYRARNPNRGTVGFDLNSWDSYRQWNAQPFEGKVFGPYIDLKDERLIGGVTGYQANGRPNVVTAEQYAGSSGPSFEFLPKVILDYWGEPIAYYRTPYDGNDLRSSVTKTDQSLANLGDIYMLRPWTISPGDEVAGEADAAGDSSSSTNLKSALFALVSMGPDKSFDRTRRRDQNEVNQDNIVQTGR